MGKGRAIPPYEFGVKASILTNDRRAPGGLFVLHARSLPDNPYGGHTLLDVLDRSESLTGCAIERLTSTRAMTATKCKIQAASSSPARSAATFVSPIASRATAPPSSPPSYT